MVEFHIHSFLLVCIYNIYGKLKTYLLRLGPKCSNIGRKHNVGHPKHPETFWNDIGTF